MKTLLHVHLWVVEECLLVVDATSRSIGESPLGMEGRLVPLLLHGKKCRVDVVAHGDALEVVDEVVVRHPAAISVREVYRSN